MIGRLTWVQLHSQQPKSWLEMGIIMTRKDTSEFGSGEFAAFVELVLMGGMLSGVFRKLKMRTIGRNVAKSWSMLSKFLIIETLWRSEGNSNSKWRFEAKVCKFPREFTPTFAISADGDISRSFARTSRFSACLLFR
jgi:hypothetical protein